jgi:hypothetical protein
MARFGTSLEGEQVLLGRLMDVGTELFAIAATCSYAQHLAAAGGPEGEGALALADHFCREAKVRIDASFRGVAVNEDASIRALSRDVLDGRHAWAERGIA